MKNGDEVHFLIQNEEVDVNEQIGMIFVVLKDLSTDSNP